MFPWIIPFKAGRHGRHGRWQAQEAAVRQKELLLSFGLRDGWMIEEGHIEIRPIYL